MPVQETLISVEEYLNTSYEGADREYLDGRVVERNVGEKDHTRPQRKIVGFFERLEPTLKTFGFPELDDYREFGIPYVWVIDPRTKSGVTHTFKEGQHSVSSGLHTKVPDIDLPAGRLFE